MKIGVFDSGVGGLTVLRELAQTFPTEEFVYLGDTARLPYGSKSPGTIRQYSNQVMDFLLTQQVGAIVIACNTASSQVPETHWKGVPVFNVIGPGAAAAVKLSRSKRIGVLGTRATIASGCYAEKIKLLDQDAEVFSQSCPLLVPLAEEGWITDSVTDLVVTRYLEPLLTRKIDTLILGCTHYPILRESIQKTCGSSVGLVDSGQAICDVIRDAFFESGAPARHGQRKISFYATDLSPHTQLMAEQIMSPLAIERFEVVEL